MSLFVVSFLGRENIYAIMMFRRYVHTGREPDGNADEGYVS